MAEYKFTPTESMSARFGESLGQGLQSLAQAKLQQLTQSREATDLASVLGISQQEAQQFVRLGLDKDKLLSNWWQRGGAQPNTANMGTTPSNSGQVGTSGTSRFSTPPLEEQRKLRETGLKEARVENELNKTSRDWSEPYIKRAEEAGRTIKNLEHLIKLAEKGDIRSGSVHQLLDKVGLSALGQNVDTQTAQKIISELGLGVGAAYPKGTKLTNFLEQTFQKTNPTLFNTPEGIIAISQAKIAPLKREEIINDTRKGLLKEWKNRIPGDADDILKEAAQPAIDKMEDEIIKSFEKAKSYTAGQELDERPKKFSVEYNRIPEGAEGEENGIIYVKNSQVPNGWIPKKK